MKRTHPPHTGHTPEQALNDLACPYCHQPWRAGHNCTGGTR